VKVPLPKTKTLLHYSQSPKGVTESIVSNPINLYQIPSKSPCAQHPTLNIPQRHRRRLARCFARSAAGASVPEVAADGRPCAQAAPDATATARCRDSENVWRMDGEWMEHLWKMDGTSGKSNFMPRKSMKVMGANSCHERTPSQVVDRPRSCNR